MKRPLSQIITTSVMLFNVPLAHAQLALAPAAPTTEVEKVLHMNLNFKIDSSQDLFLVAKNDPSTYHRIAGRRKGSFSFEIPELQFHRVQNMDKKNEMGVRVPNATIIADGNGGWNYAGYINAERVSLRIETKSDASGASNWSFNRDDLFNALDLEKMEIARKLTESSPVGPAQVLTMKDICEQTLDGHYEPGQVELSNQRSDEPTEFVTSASKGQLIVEHRAHTISAQSTCTVKVSPDMLKLMGINN